MGGLFGGSYDEQGRWCLPDTEMPESRKGMTDAELIAEMGAVSTVCNAEAPTDERLDAVNRLRATEMLSEADAAYLISKIYEGR